MKIYAEVAKNEKQSANPARILTKAEFRAFCAQHPEEARVFGVILSKWRASRSSFYSSQGFWTAYTLDEWALWTKTPVRTLKRRFNVLWDNGLIERERHKHGGTAVKSFIRPTVGALKISNHLASDWKP